ncbi:hypothetical protein BZL41_26985 [Pseudomonas sp. PIC25]|nr:hypothetical protein BZL41_26985 [Pseudomonas sp. PIC25]
MLRKQIISTAAASTQESTAFVSMLDTKAIRMFAKMKAMKMSWTASPIAMPLANGEPNHLAEI